jgi:hypothetical protein
MIVVMAGPARPASERERMPRRVPAIHVFSLKKAWITETRSVDHSRFASRDAAAR